MYDVSFSSLLGLTVLMLICYAVFFKGLDIYKYYIAFVGGISLAIVGGIVGFAIDYSSDGAQIGAVVGFLIGILVAWWFYKFFIYVSAFLIGLLIFGILGRVLIGENAFGLTGMLGALFSLFLVYKFRDIVIVTMMAVPFAILLFFISVPSSLDQIDDLANISFERTLRIMVGFKAPNNAITFFDASVLVMKAYFLRFLMIVSVFTWFSAYYQIKSKNNRDDFGGTILFKTTYRDMSKWFALLSLLYVISHRATGMTFGFTLTLWPLLAIVITMVLLNWQKTRLVRVFSPEIPHKQWIFFSVVSFVVIPLSIWVLSLPYYLRVIETISNKGSEYLPFGRSLGLWFKAFFQPFYNLFSFKDIHYMNPWIFILFKIIILLITFVVIPLIFRRISRTRLNPL